MAIISKFQDLWKRSSISFKVGFIILFIHILIAITGPFWAPYHYAEINVGEPLTGMSWKYPFGVDSLGRDIFSRVIHGSWMVISLSILGTSCLFLRFSLLINLLIISFSHQQVHFLS